MDNPISSLKSIPPKELAIIAVGGIGLGLVWRRFSKRDAPVQQPTPDTAQVPDTTDLGLSTSSSGNLAGKEPDTPTEARGSTIPLSVVGWVTNLGGKRYWTDGNSLFPIDAEPTTTAGTTVTLKRGESLITVVRRHYRLSGTALANKVKLVASANGLVYNSKTKSYGPFHVGQVIKLP